MTGPGIGKIPLNSRVYLAFGFNKYELNDCNIYLHVKGYSLARVTHIDVEHSLLNQIIKPYKREFLSLKVMGDSIIISLKRSHTVKDDGNRIEVSTIIIKSKEMARILGRIKTMVYVGGKVGGIFLGFRKIIIRRLEDYAIQKGYKPKRLSEDN